jgi:hypothetical protein
MKTKWFGSFSENLQKSNSITPLKPSGNYCPKIPARNAIYAHAQDFSAGDELLLAILKACIPLPLNKQQTIGFHVF